MMIPQQNVQTYLLGSFYYTYGQIEFPEMNYTAILRGVNFGFGPGASFHLYKSLYLGIEGIMEVGWGYWNGNPLPNSTDFGVNLNSIRLQTVLSVQL